MLDAARALPWASGGTVGDQLDRRGPAGKAALDRAISRAPVLSADYVTDGSARVELGLPIEAVRIAIEEPRWITPGPATPSAPTAIVVDARRFKIALAVGFHLDPATVAPVVFATTPPGADVLGAAPVQVRATRVQDGTLHVEGADLGGVSGALVVVMVRQIP